MSQSTLWCAGLAELDQAVAGLIRSDARGEAAALNLIASASYCPPATLEAETSSLIDRNITGRPGARSVGGCEAFDAIETLAQQRACALFGAETANVSALSATVANLAVFRAFLQSGDTMLAFNVEAGGHGSHGGPGSAAGSDYRVVGFGTRDGDGRLDYDAAMRLARSVRPKLIVAGQTTYPREIDFGRLAEVADEIGAILVADIAHVAGLVVAGLHQNPTQVCEVVTSSTHKTLCGPRTGGLILSRARSAGAIERALYPGLQGPAGAHIIAARAVLFGLVGRPEFAGLMRRVVANATAFAEALKARGLELYTGGTDTHMVVVDLRGQGNFAEIAARLNRVGLWCNPVGLPKRGSGPSGGLRFGTTALTLRGMDCSVMAQIAGLVVEAVAPATNDDRLARQVSELASEYPLPCFPSFGGTGRPHN